MELSHQCPICGKEGIPDFRQEIVVCPCCGSDLTIYKKLREVTEEGYSTPKIDSEKKRGLTALICILFVVIFLLSGYIIFVKNYNDGILKEKKELTHQIIVLQDSIQRISIQMTEGTKNINVGQFRIYIVKKGDSFRRISHKFFGTEQRFDEIAAFNNLEGTAIIHTGDTIKIPS